MPGTEGPLRGGAKLLAALIGGTGRVLVRPPSGCGFAAGGAILATALAYAWKRPLAALFERHGGEAATCFAEGVAAFGSGNAVVVLGFAVLVVGAAFRRPALVDAALVLGAAGLWCWLLTKTGQIVLAERRPIDGGDMRWFSVDGHGVSGHAAAAAVLLAPARDVLFRNARKPIRDVATWMIVAWALIVGWSRMWLGMHFLWNVVLGFAIGLYAGRAGTAAWARITGSGSAKAKLS